VTPVEAFCVSFALTTFVGAMLAPLLDD